MKKLQVKKKKKKEKDCKSIKLYINSEVYPKKTQATLQQQQQRNQLTSPQNTNSRSITSRSSVSCEKIYPV